MFNIETVISQIRKAAFNKILCGFMGLYLLNLSVDTAGLNPQYFREDVSLNDQESIIEICVETIAGYEDAFKEYADYGTDTHDTENNNKKSNVRLEIIAQYTVDSGINQISIKTAILDFHDRSANLTKGFNQLDTPPPKI